MKSLQLATGASLVALAAGVDPPSASDYRPQPATAIESEVYAIVTPTYMWANQFFGLTAHDVHDNWHDASGVPNATKAQIGDFVQQAVAAWKTVGTKLSETIKKVDTLHDNSDYRYLLKYLIPNSFDSPLFMRASVYWNSQLNLTVSDSTGWAHEWDEAWLGTILAVETVVPHLFRDYEVITDSNSGIGFWSPGSLTNYNFPRMDEHLQAVPWELVVDYCNSSNKCSNRLAHRAADTCVSTRDVPGNITKIGVGNDNRGFPWTCQIYSDDACQNAVSIPAQPCTLPPPFDVYCQPTSDWDGKFGNDASRSSTSNPSGAQLTDGGSFKCTTT
ncbi:hypothetical protein BKA62DRAFT_834538 [Auriculariales sp. MPI-PUGE-AT-0066]|nr:hypothetical protein BKA62DRAFT_834538 [Auriculariales sp. MPI-PUGE-AT-0066]